MVIIVGNSVQGIVAHAVVQYSIYCEKTFQSIEESISHVIL